MREHPRLWRDLPPALKQGVIDRVQAQLPAVVTTITDEIGVHIDQLLDPKIMVIDHFRKNPELVVRVFRDVGQRELNLMVLFGFIFGFLLGIPVAIVDQTWHIWWLLPVLGVFVGWTTNALGMWLIFEPPEPRRILGIKVQGLFLRRQDECAEVYAGIIADDVITLERIGDFLMDGPRGDRTRQMIATAMRPAIDKAAGPLRGAAKVVVGAETFDRIRESFAMEAVGRTITPFRDPAFSKRAVGEDQGADRPAYQGAAAEGLRRDDALGHQGGRVDALRPRRRHGCRRRVHPPGAVQLGLDPRFPAVITGRQDFSDDD